MKTCPTCKRTYPDESFTFCLDDGTLLSAPHDPDATLRFSPYDAAPSIKNQTTTLNVHENGTATDSATGLMWMIPFAGQNWVNNSPVGMGVALSWTEATEYFGRGRLINVPPEKDATPYWDLDDGDKPELSRNSYNDYQIGSRSIHFAGFHDWRLPTVEEWFTLAGIPRVEDVFRQASLDVWTANPSNLSPFGNPRRLRELLKFPPECAWWAQWDSVFGDIGVNQKYVVRLVRGGSIFNILH